MTTTPIQLDINTDNFIDTINKLANANIKSKEDICNYLKLDVRDFMTLIKANNMYYDKSKGMYHLKELHKATTKNKPHSPSKALTKDTLDKVTYRIPKQLNDTLKLQCIIEDTTATDIIIKALNSYIPQSTKDTLNKLKK